MSDILLPSDLPAEQYELIRDAWSQMQNEAGEIAGSRDGIAARMESVIAAQAAKSEEVRPLGRQGVNKCLERLSKLGCFNQVRPRVYVLVSPRRTTEVERGSWGYQETASRGLEVLREVAKRYPKGEILVSRSNPQAAYTSLGAILYQELGSSSLVCETAVAHLERQGLIHRQKIGAGPLFMVQVEPAL